MFYSSHKKEMTTKEKRKKRKAWMKLCHILRDDQRSNTRAKLGLLLKSIILLNFTMTCKKLHSTIHSKYATLFTSFFFFFVSFLFVLVSFNRLAVLVLFRACSRL